MKGPEIRKLVIQHYLEKMPAKQIAKAVHSGIKFVYKVIQDYKRGYASKKSHRTKKLDNDDEKYIRELYAEDSQMFPTEVQGRLEDERGKVVSVATVRRTIYDMKLTRKKNTNLNPEANPIAIANFVLDANDLTADQILATDETHNNDTTSCRSHGYSPKGERAYSHNITIRGQRYSCCGLLSLRGMEAVDIVEEAYTGEAFERFLTEQLPIVSTPFPGPRSVLLMDNINLHKGDSVRALCNALGVRILFTPGYSPQYNPIEQCFSTMKRWLRGPGRTVRRVCPGLDAVTLIRRAFQAIEPEHVPNHYRSSGYTVL